MAPLATDFAHTGIKLNLLKKIRGLKVPKITDKKQKQPNLMKENQKQRLAT